MVNELSLYYDDRSKKKLQNKPSKSFVIETVHCPDLSVFVIHETLKRLINFFYYKMRRTHVSTHWPLPRIVTLQERTHARCHILNDQTN